MRIAIVGSGISGLVAAYRLHSCHDITVFEANDYIGGHTHTVDVELDGERHAVDTGFIVFNDRTYPRFISLLHELRVASHPTTMSFSVRDDRTALEYNGHSLNTLFAQRRNLVRPRFYRLLADIARFSAVARRLLRRQDVATTVGEFLSKHRFSTEFREQYLLPMGSAIWSCPIGAFAEFPIAFVAEFYDHHGLLDFWNRPVWRVIRGGSRTYVEQLTGSFRDRIRLQTPVIRVRRHAERVELVTRGGGVESFDHVVFACHSDQALRILGSDAMAHEREILGAFPYTRNVAVLHTDERVLPRSRRAWAAWNYRCTGDAAAPATVTYNMNLLQRIRSRHTFCVTLGDESHIAAHRILGRFEYHHPIFTAQRAAAQARHAELLNQRRTSFCGAYWRNGFHEDGVASAEAVVAALHARRAAGRFDVPAERLSEHPALSGVGG